MTIFKILAARGSFFHHIWLILSLPQQGKSLRSCWNKAGLGQSSEEQRGAAAFTTIFVYLLRPEWALSPVEVGLFPP